MPSFKNRVNAIILWVDMLIVSICLFITIAVFRSENQISLLTVDVWLWLFLLTGWYFTAKNYDLYEEAARRGLVKDFFKIAKNVFFQAVFVSVFLFIAKQPEYSRRFAAIYILLLCILLPLQKLVYKKVLIFFINNGKKFRQVLIVGAGKVGMDFHRILIENAHLGYEVAGFLDDQPREALKEQYLGTVDQISNILQQHEEIEEIVVALPNTSHEKINQVIKAAKNEAVRVRIIPGFFHLLTTQCSVGMLEGMPLITLRREPLEEYHWRAVKRIFDIFFSSFILLFICSWLFPIIALAIKLSSPGPVFFVQLRTGRNKKPFKCLKFRSMQVNPDSDKVQARKDDARFTRVGQFLRKTNLDELPQFINVLKGEMSVVGPRPHMLKHTEEYSQMVDQYLVRHLLKSGITGWAQVNGYRGETRHPREMQARVEHDVWYLENWSLLFDLRIIFLTVWTTIKGQKNAW